MLSIRVQATIQQLPAVVKAQCKMPGNGVTNTAGYRRKAVVQLIAGDQIHIAGLAAISEPEKLQLAFGPNKPG
jgi:hypothetical protein